MRLFNIRVASSIVAFGLLVVLSGCSSSLDQDAKDAVAARVVRAQDRLQEFLSSELTETDLVSEISGNIEEDIRAVSADAEPGTHPSQGFYSFREHAEKVQVKFLLRAGVISGGFSSQTRGYYTCVELRGDLSAPEKDVTVHAEECPIGFTELFGLSEDTFIDASELELTPAE